MEKKKKKKNWKEAKGIKGITQSVAPAIILDVTRPGCIDVGIATT